MVKGYSSACEREEDHRFGELVSINIIGEGVGE